MAETPWFHRLQTTFYIDDVEQREPASGYFPLQQGQGVIWGDGLRYRVRDVWFNFERHAAFDLGLHIFLEPLSEDDDDVPLRLEPRYYGGGEDPG